MTDNEIIKALECCCNPCGNDCEGCPKIYQEYDTVIECGFTLMDDALSLINRQKAEIKRLQKYDEERNIRLHARLIEKARAEAIKEFAERLKAKFDPYDVEHYCYAMIDDVAKEMGAN